MKKILISQRRDCIANRDETRDVLDTRWARILFELGYLPVPVCSELAGEDIYIERLKPDGILLTGGNDIGQAPARDLIEVQLLDSAYKKGLPVLGVCRGMQMINHYLGGSLVEVQNHVAIRHLIEGDWAKQHGYQGVNSYHNQAIVMQTIAKQLKVLATTVDGVIEAVAHCTQRWIGIMWHPEREIEITKQDATLILKLFGDDK